MRNLIERERLHPTIVRRLGPLAAFLNLTKYMDRLLRWHPEEGTLAREQFGQTMKIEQARRRQTAPEMPSAQ
jgi:hypothetical protein